MSTHPVDRTLVQRQLGYSTLDVECLFVTDTVAVMVIRRFLCDTGEGMYTFKIRSIEKPIAWINGMDSCLDFPLQASFEEERLNLGLIGWVSSRDAKIASIWLAWRGRKIADAKIFPRPDLEEIYIGCNNVGFQIDVAPIALGTDEPLKIMVEVEGGRVTSLYNLYLDFTSAGEAQLDDPVSDDVRDIAIAPIISIARSGTTYLSKLLHQHGMALGYDRYPYEAHIAEELAKRWFRDAQPTSCEPAWNRGGQDIDPTTHAILGLYNAHKSEQLDCITRHIRDAGRLHYIKAVNYYRMLSPDSLSSVIVEKIGLSYELDLLKGLFRRVRPIFLLRDPRDILISMRKFNESRANYDFDEAHSKGFSGLVFKIGNGLRELAWRLDCCVDPKILVHYEDLVKDPQAALGRIHAHFEENGELNLTKQSAESLEMHGHATSLSPLSSVGRWRQELSRSEQEMANWYFQPFLARFGYELA